MSSKEHAGEEVLHRLAATAVGRVLTELLGRPGAYRDLWERRAVRAVPEGSVGLSAVATVLAEHLWAHGERDVKPRQLKDRVRRALSSGPVTAETVRWVADAFTMTDVDRALLTSAHRDDHRAATRSASIGLLPHETIALHELHTVGADRKPVKHRTMQVIRALVDGVSSYAYRFDAATSEVRVIRGGRLAHPPVPGEADMQVATIELPRPLQRGETWPLEYETHFFYATPPAPEFRRGFRRRVQSLEMRVEFSPRAQPSQLWWSAWRQLDDSEPASEVATLAGDASVHRYLSVVAGAIVGFRWLWPT